LGGGGKALAAAEKLYADLTAAGVEVLIDATDDRAGSKFANADLIGAPLRVISSEKTLEQGRFELGYHGIFPGEAMMPIGTAAGDILKIIRAK